MTYQEYIDTNTSTSDKWAFSILTGFISSDKFRGMAFHVLDNYDNEQGVEAINMAFDWLEGERGFFPSDTKGYFLNIALEVYADIVQQHAPAMVVIK